MGLCSWEKIAIIFSHYTPVYINVLLYVQSAKHARIQATGATEKAQHENAGQEKLQGVE